MNKLKLLIVLMIIFTTTLLSGCSASEQAVKTSVASTLAAMATIPAPTATFTPQPSLTSTPTLTPTSTSTPTQTPTSTPTMTATPDMRIIDVDPQKLLCTDKDLPIEGKYYIPNEGWMSINTNNEVISMWGVEKGREYVIQTGRVTGWWVARKRDYKGVRLPEEIDCGVYTFKTAQGAQLAMTEFNSVKTQKGTNGKYVDKIMLLGDKNLVTVFHNVDSGGNKNTEYEIYFTYRNLMISVIGYSQREDDVSHDVIEAIARKMLDRIAALPVVSPEDAVIAK